MKAVTIRIEDNVHKQLKYLSFELSKSINEYINELIIQDLERRKEIEKNNN